MNKTQIKNEIQLFAAIFLFTVCGCQSEKHFPDNENYYIGNDRNKAYYCSRKTKVYKCDSPDGFLNIELGMLGAYLDKKVEHSFPIQSYIKARFPYIHAFYIPPVKKQKDYIDGYIWTWLTGMIEYSPSEFEKLISGEKYVHIELYEDFNDGTYTTAVSYTNMDAIKAADKEVERVLLTLVDIAYHDKQLAIETHKHLYIESIELRKFYSILEHISNIEKSSNSKTDLIQLPLLQKRNR